LWPVVYECVRHSIRNIEAKGTSIELMIEVKDMNFPRLQIFFSYYPTLPFSRVYMLLLNNNL